MITRVEGGLTYTQTFDAENRLISVTVNSQTTQFLYDGDGNLVKKTKPDGSKTIYAAGGVYEVDKTSGGSVTRTVTYYPAGGAMRINITSGSNTLYYILKDHLGSASVVTDSTGAVVGEQRYYPFGETRLTTGTIFTDQLFTGQREMTGLGIYHYNARFYSPKLGRFLSADTIVPGAANPQAYNRYSYVLGNPLRYIDPTGHCGVNGDADADDCHTPDGVVTSDDDSGIVIKDGDNDRDDDPHDPLDGLDNGPIAAPYSGGVPTVTTTETTPEQPCMHCGGPFLGIWALLEGLNLAVVGGAAAVLVIGSTAPLWATVIPAAIFVGVALVGVNWMLVGFQEINASLHPDEHIEIDYLPLVPDSWQK